MTFQTNYYGKHFRVNGLSPTEEVQNVELNMKAYKFCF